MTSWDEEAAAFDEEPDHGLRDPRVRAAWANLLLPTMPRPAAVVADVGCGTGSLTALLSAAGHTVHGLDRSAAMLAAAVRKTSAAFVRADAAAPPFRAGSVDVVLARHVLWALPDPDSALVRWVRLLRPGGRLVLVEGRWSTGAGIRLAECRTLVRRHRDDVTTRRLDDPALWGRAVEDERYLLVSRR
ncbi:MAG TPA: class I SAM-dependent methyltransferase [Actinophytocola sp.]|nr:class I SAM-dependent methyltransferase [Actinophytocola sp.]